jgi:hypothetical protein
VLDREPRNAAAQYSLGAFESGAGNYLQALKHITQAGAPPSSSSVEGS